MTKIEEVARALYSREYVLDDFDSPDCKELRAYWLGLARAAVEAMRPTDEILEAVQEKTGYEVEFIGGGGNFRFCTNDLREIQCAMIDAILNEKA